MMFGAAVDSVLSTVAGLDDSFPGTRLGERQPDRPALLNRMVGPDKAGFGRAVLTF